MLTREIGQAQAKMLAALKALGDYQATEPFSFEIARLLLRDLNIATEQFTTVVDAYLKSTKLSLSTSNKPHLV
jgi:hypothetical protein